MVCTSRLGKQLESVETTKSVKIHSDSSLLQYIHKSRSFREYLVRHRLLDNVSKVLAAILACDITDAGSEVEDAPLGKGALDEPRDVGVGVADSLETARDVDSVEEPRNLLVEVGTDLGVGDRRNGRVGGRGVPEDGEGLAVSGGRGGRSESEDGRSG